MDMPPHYRAISYLAIIEEAINLSLTNKLCPDMVNNR